MTPARSRPALAWEALDRAGVWMSAFIRNDRVSYAETDGGSTEWCPDERWVGGDHVAAHLGVASATARRSSCRTMGGRTATRGAGTSSPTSCHGIARTGAPARRGTSEMELGIVDLKPFLPSLEGRARRRRGLGADDQRPGVVFVERAGRMTALAVPALTAEVVARAALRSGGNRLPRTAPAPARRRS